MAGLEKLCKLKGTGGGAEDGPKSAAAFVGEVMRTA
jgi:hypothetical protein